MNHSFHPAYQTVIHTEWQIPSVASIHLLRYSPFRALASLIRRLHSSLFAALLIHPLVPSSCSASLWTTSAHLVLGLPTGLMVWKFPFRTFFLQVSHRYSCFSWWWAHRRPKHGQKRNKHTKKICAPNWLYLQEVHTNIMPPASLWATQNLHPRGTFV